MKGYRTIIFNAVMLIGSLSGATFSPDMVNEWIEAFALVWTAGNIILRAVTSSPIFKKE